MTNLIRSNFQPHLFHLVSPSPWPLLISVSLLTLTTVGVLTMHVFFNADHSLYLALLYFVLCFYFCLICLSYKGFDIKFIKFLKAFIFLVVHNLASICLITFFKNYTIDIFSILNIIENFYCFDIYQNILLFIFFKISLIMYINIIISKKNSSLFMFMYTVIFKNNSTFKDTIRNILFFLFKYKKDLLLFVLIAIVTTIIFRAMFNQMLPTCEYTALKIYFVLFNTYPFVVFLSFNIFKYIKTLKVKRNNKNVYFSLDFKCLSSFTPINFLFCLIMYNLSYYFITPYIYDLLSKNNVILNIGNILDTIFKGHSKINNIYKSFREIFKSLYHTNFKYKVSPFITNKTATHTFKIHKYIPSHHSILQGNLYTKKNPCLIQTTLVYRSSILSTLSNKDIFVFLKGKEISFIHYVDQKGTKVTNNDLLEIFNKNKFINITSNNNEYYILINKKYKIISILDLKDAFYDNKITAIAKKIHTLKVFDKKFITYPLHIDTNKCPAEITYKIIDNDFIFLSNISDKLLDTHLSLKEPIKNKSFDKQFKFEDIFGDIPQNNDLIVNMFRNFDLDQLANQEESSSSNININPYSIYPGISSSPTTDKLSSDINNILNYIMNLNNNTVAKNSWNNQSTISDHSLKTLIIPYNTEDFSTLIRKLSNILENNEFKYEEYYTYNGNILEPSLGRADVTLNTYSPIFRLASALATISQIKTILFKQWSWAIPAQDHLDSPADHVTGNGITGKLGSMKDTDQFWFIRNMVMAFGDQRFKRSILQLGTFNAFTIWTSYLQSIEQNYDTVDEFYQKHMKYFKEEFVAENQVENSFDIDGFITAYIDNGNLPIIELVEVNIPDHRFYPRP